MSSRKWLALAAWALLPLAATAQEKHSPIAPRTAASLGGSVEYQSAFADYRAFTEEGATPDKQWRSANQEMGKLGGHAGHIKDAPAVTPIASSEEPPAAAKQSRGMNHDHHHGGGHP